MQPFIVKLFGLSSGRNVFKWKADREFFESFANPDILDADLDVEAAIVNRGATVDVECTIGGKVTVPCDRCLDDLEIPVNTEFSDTCTPDGDELDLSQDVYDFVCIALPMQRVHGEGQCNNETIKYLCK